MATAPAIDIDFIKFNSLPEALAEKKHNLGSDSLKILLSNTAPSVANTVKGDITEISAGNGYSAGGIAMTISSSSTSGGTYSLKLSNVSLTASGGNIGPFRYLVLYNDTAASDELIAMWDIGSAWTIGDGETFEITFNASLGVIYIT